MILDANADLLIIKTEKFGEREIAFALAHLSKSGGSSDKFKLDVDCIKKACAMRLL